MTTGTPDDDGAGMPRPGGATPVVAERVPSRYAGVTRQIAPLLVLAGLIGSALITVPEQFGYRAACAGIAGTCLVAAAMRAVLPTSWVGILAVRGRLLDVVLYVAAGVGVVLLAFSVPLPGGG
ncbi:MAG: DUF3017 domain-containing protein [Kineosporiaceae bacterium]